MKVEVEYLKDHGQSEKGDDALMFSSTAKALAKHEVVKITGKQVWSKDKKKFVIEPI